MQTVGLRALVDKLKLKNKKQHKEEILWNGYLL